MDLLLRSQRCVLPGGVAAATLVIQEGRISALADYHYVCGAESTVDAGDKVVMAGLVDTHVHLNDPGRRQWEGFATGTQAAAAGGVTTIVDMPLNSSPVTTTPEALEAKVTAAKESAWVDYGLWGGLVPANHDSMAELLAAGCLGIKCFLVPSGIDEFPAVGESDLASALPVLARWGAPLLAHGELSQPIDEATRGLEKKAPDQYATYLASRPDSAELAAIDLLLKLAEGTHATIHLVHLATAQGLPRLGEAKQRGLPISVETCPHYLTFAAEEIATGATEFKCAPPLRSRSTREGLWQGLREGIIDLIATDHSPCLPKMKLQETGDFLRAWGGIASLQLSLPAVWTEAEKRGFSIEDLSRWMSAAPARLAGLENRKGCLAVGYDADIVVWQPDDEFQVNPGELFHRHPTTPYAGRRLKGKVDATYLRGQEVFRRGKPFLAARGKWLRRHYDISSTS